MLTGLMRGLMRFCRGSCCLLLIAVTMEGCVMTSSLPDLQQLRPLPADEPLCRVAVLPFTSESDYPQSAAIATKVLLAELQNLGNYLVTQEGDVDKLFLQLRILPTESPSREQLQILASRIHAQLLFTGHVIEMRENPGSGGSVNPVLAMRIDILDGRTAEVLWSIYHRRQGLDYQKVMHFGTINSIAGLTKQVEVEMLNFMITQGLPQCDVLPRF